MENGNFFKEKPEITTTFSLFFVTRPAIKEEKIIDKPASPLKNYSELIPDKLIRGNEYYGIYYSKKRASMARAHSKSIK